MKLKLFGAQPVKGHQHLVTPRGWPYDDYILYRCDCGWFRWKTT